MLIVTVTQQRSGSKFLCSILRKRFGVPVFGELFNPDSLATFSYRNFLLARGLERMLRDGTDFALNEYFEGFSDLGGVQQFDVMFNQMEWLSMGWNPFAYEFLYGFLRSKNAIVLSLVRSALDVFLSQKTLEISGIPHVFAQDSDSRSACAVAAEKLEGRRARLDPEECASFIETLGIRRRRLREAFSGYRLFAEINYESLAASGSVDAAIVNLIQDAAALHGIPRLTDGSLVTNIAPIRVLPDYDQIFENVEDLRRVDSYPH